MATDDVWLIGASYERYIGRWSRPVAAEFLRWLDLPAGGRWLDVGCGTGALSAAILTACAPAAVTGVDPSPGFLSRAAADVPGAEFVEGDGEHLPAGPFDVVVSALALNFVPDPAAAVAAMRAAAPGGTVAAYVWDYAERMQLLRMFWDAAVAEDPAATELDEAVRFPLCAPGRLSELWHGAGLRAVETRAIDVETRFADFDDFWSPFTEGQGPAPTYVAQLPAVRRDALRDRLRERLPTAADGSIALIARAWAVRGTAQDP